MEKYELVKYLGSGSFGVANLCRDKETSELVAIKFIQRGPTIDENVEREIINHRTLQHQNVIRFKEVFLTPTHLALVMEYASGGELFERICKWGRCTEDEARYFFRQLIFGVNYIHSREICHRDLKLDNILLDGRKSPCLKICDFGYSKRICHRVLKLNTMILYRRKSTHKEGCDFGHCKQMFHKDLMLDSSLLDGSPTPKLKEICHKDLTMLDSILLDGCPAPQSKIFYFDFFKQILFLRKLMQDKILSDGSPAKQLKICDFGFPKQICSRDLLLDNTISVGRPTPQFKNCDSGFSKFYSKPNTNVGSATYTAPEVLNGRDYDGKMADVWSCGVTLYVMLVAAYPFEDPNDSENSEKTIKRIMDGGYNIPDYVHISKDCQHLLSCIFVQNPSRRISIKEIMSHPWFLKNLQSELTEPTQKFFYERDNSTFSHQSVEEIMKIVVEARNQLTPLSTTIMGYGLKTVKDHEIELEEEEEDEEDEYV